MNPFPDSIKGARVMVFVDGENLAIRYGCVLGGKAPLPHVEYEPDVFVWSKLLNMQHHVSCEVTRCHYYTSVPGDKERKDQIHDKLQAMDIQAPRVFHRDKLRGSKQVDVSLTVEMLNHAYRNNYDVAVLVAGDGDYIPLVKAVMDSGHRVFLWFIDGGSSSLHGLSPALRRSVDYYYNLDTVLFNENAPRYFGQ